jgi:2-dehydro-3-deoxygalactonokinase
LLGLGELPGSATICLPGTHSKWIDLVDGRIFRFRTYMTGELRALLLAAGSLATPTPQISSRDAFLAAFDMMQAGGSPTRALFQARARRLLGTLDPAHTASFVSGILTGAEIAAESGRGGSLILAAHGALAEDYSAALAKAGMRHTLADPEALAARGLLRIATCAKLFAA